MRKNKREINTMFDLSKNDIKGGLLAALFWIGIISAITGSLLWLTGAL